MEGIAPARSEVLEASRTSATLTLLLAMLCGCGGGSSPTEPPAPAPPPSMLPASLIVTAAEPAAGSTLRAGMTERFVVHLHFSAGESATQPEFLAGHLTQSRGGVVIDNPGEFHFAVSGHEGDVDAALERAILPDTDTCDISWVMAVRNASGLLAVNGPRLTYRVAP